MVSIESLRELKRFRELTEFEAQRLEALTAVVKELRHYADLACEDARAARDAGNAGSRTRRATSVRLFADRAALDRAADILQWG